MVRGLGAALIVLLGVTTAQAERIRHYAVDLVGMADGSLSVEEQIDYDFEGANKHGIYRDIPNTVPGHVGGRRTLEFSQVSITQDGRPARWIEESTSGDAGPMVRYRIGDPDRTISGRHRYTLTYLVDDALLPSGDLDAFRWNAIGTGWDLPIDRAEIHLLLPNAMKGNDAVELRYWNGTWGEIRQEGQAEWVAEEGSFSVLLGHLRPHEGVTVEASFPPGLIPATAHPATGVLLREAVAALWAWPLMLLGLGLAWRHWYRVGRDPDVGAIAVRYKPPKNLEAAEAGLLIDQSLDDTDLTGTVIELARDGWLEIEHPKAEGLIDKLLTGNRVTLKRTRSSKEWQELPPYKQHLMECFFCRGPTFSPGGTESASVVQERNNWLEKSKARIHERAVEHRLFPENPKKVRGKYLLGAALLGALLLGMALWFSPMAPESKFMATFSTVFIAVFSLTGYRIFTRTKGRIAHGVGAFIIVALMVTQFLPVMVGLFDLNFPGWISILFDPLTPTIVLVFGLLLFAWQMPRRTEIGARVQRELLGFKQFMERAERDRIRFLLKEDPDYFEHTLPYAALFGLVATWAAQFEGLIAMPVWYSGSSFDHLGHDLDHLSSTGVSSSPPASSGGSSGGGGFSGGGGGGGGGGSW